jgi:hypothetical protein
MMNDCERLISGVAFPIAVAAYLLIYVRKTLDDLKTVIASNTTVITNLSAVLRTIQATKAVKTGPQGAEDQFPDPLP